MPRYTMNSKYLNHFTSLNSQISRNLRDAVVVTRDINSNGLWCHLLLPTILLLYNILYTTSPLYSLIAYISVSLSCYCVIFIVFISVSCLILFETGYGGCIVCSLMSTLLIYVYMEHDALLSIAFALPAVILFSLLLCSSLTECPKTFTLGEAMITTQGITLFIIMCIAQVTYYYDSIDDNEKLIYLLVVTFLSIIGSTVTALYKMQETKRTVKSLTFVTSLGIFTMLIVLHIILGRYCVLRILNYLFFTKKRVELLCLWLFLLLLATLVLVVRTKTSVKADTIARKSFHLLASLVFLSGILADEQFMRLAAGGGLGLLLFVESLRKLKIESVSEALNSTFNVYRDEKDCGTIAVTPVYLYCGLACPLLLVWRHQHAELELLSGVLAIGIGDSAASYFGAKYGKLKWSGTNKTVEGTVFNVLSQVATVVVLDVFGLLTVKHAALRTLFAGTVSALLEAKTTQVDNLVLPLVTIIAFQVTSLLF